MICLDANRSVRGRRHNNAAKGGVEPSYAVFRLREWREDLVSEAQVDGQPGSGAPVVLDVNIWFLCAVERMNGEMGALLQGGISEQERRERVPSGPTAVVGKRGIELPCASWILRLLNAKQPEDNAAADFDAMRAPGFGYRSFDLMVVILSLHGDKRRIANCRVSGRIHLEPGQPRCNRIA
jgi:hypothetical protein